MATSAWALPAALLAASALAVVVAAAVWQHRPRKGATWLAITAGAFAFTGVGQAAVLVSGTAGAARLWTAVSIVGTAIIPLAFLVFAARYSGADDWVSGPRLAAIWAPAVAYVGFAFLNPAELVFQNAVLGPDGSFAFTWGPVAWAWFAYQAGVVLAAEALLGRKLLRSRNVYRRRTALFAAIGAVIWLSHSVDVVGAGPLPNQTLTPLLFLSIGAFSLAVLADDRMLRLIPIERVMGLFGAQFDALAPIARDLVIEEMGSGVVVLDGDNRVVDLNPAARRMFGAQGHRIVGKNVQEVVEQGLFRDGEPAFLDPSVTEGTFSGVWVDLPTGESRCYDVVLTDLSERRSEVAGRVAIIHDVTEQRRRKQQLEEQTRELQRQNDHLEEFASVVSHDLRNPLTVAQGRVETAIDTGDVSILEPALDAHERMNDIIEDVLALAREGQTVQETRPIDLTVVAREAWSTVQTADATLALDVDGDQVVQADEGRLRRLLENLFRNAVEHGRPPEGELTVTVGSLADGFYVADDGEGIPEAERERVLKRGVTTADQGSGFGLAIVSSIVDAHGWDLDVTTSEDGGARFDVTGTSRPRATPQPPVEE